MISVKFDSSDLIKKLNKTVEYSDGFLSGAEQNRLSFNRFLGGYTVEALGKYIDAKARMNPESLHHVYEWNTVGNESGRLFSFSVTSTSRTIKINGKFLKSKSISETSNEPFKDKAEIMESGVSIEISPKNSEYLVFENNGELVFSTKSITVNHPGGKEVAGSFERTVDGFFNHYFTNALLAPFLKQLSTADEFIKYFPQGTKSGSSIGVKAGREYFSISGEIL